MSILKNKWFKFFLQKDFHLSFMVIFISLGLSSALGVFVPRILKDLYDALEENYSFFQKFYLLLFLFIAQYLLKSLYQIGIAKLTKTAIQKIRALSFRSWVQTHEGSPLKNDYEEFPMGEVMARIVADTDSIRELASSGSFTLVMDFLFLLSSFISFILIVPGIGLSLVAVELFVLIFLIYLTRYIAKAFMKLREENGHVFRVTADLIGGLNNAYYYAEGSNYYRKRFSNRLESFLHYQLKANVYDAVNYSLAESLFPIFLCSLAFILPFYEVVSVAVLGVLIDLIQRSIGPIQEMSSKMTNIQRSFVGIKRVDFFLNDLLPYEEEKGFLDEGIKEDKKNISSFSIKIDSFKYPNGKKVLEKIDFSISSPSKVGIVGQSGAGKSTLVNIISGALPLREGKILVDGENLKEGYPRLVSLISQDTHLFHASLGMNLSLSEEVTDDLKNFWKIMQESFSCLQKKYFVLDEKLDVTELSVGEKQLIAALRACYLRRPIVIFDEISASLDPLLEEALAIILSSFFQDSLVFFVAHRLETIKNSDMILVMKEGRIVAQDIHHNLIKSSKEYQDFINELKDSY